MFGHQLLLNMSSPMLSALCRPVSSTLYKLSSTNQLPKCWRTFDRLLSCSRQQVSSSSWLNAQKWSSTGCRTFLPGFRSGVRNFEERSMRVGHHEYNTTICRPISVSAQHLAKKAEYVTVHFINRDGEKITVKGKTGDNLLDTVLDNDLDIDGYGACEGTLSCSTCHLIFPEEFFQKVPKPSDEELDMLDLAYGQTDMSRLGCQVILTKDMDGMTVVVPEGVADARDV